MWIQCIWASILCLSGQYNQLLDYVRFVVLIGIFIVGLGAGNLFPLIFSIAINKMPSRSNEISGLLTMAIVGGAIVPPILGMVNSAAGVVGGISVLIACFSYMFVLPLVNGKE